MISLTYMLYTLGKSAIVAAIQLCLGARASQTQRSGNLSGFIREGSPGPAICRVFIHNEGADAFEPDKYGAQIIIERKIPKSGGASFALYGFPNGPAPAAKEVLISNERRELDSMLRNFNIHIDNPCCVLTQDESKKFIQGTDEQRYEFFLKVTDNWKALAFLNNHLQLVPVFHLLAFLSPYN